MKLPNVKQDDIVKYGALAIGAYVALSFLSQFSGDSAPAPKAVVKAVPTDNLDFAGSYYGEDDDDYDDAYAYAGESEMHGGGTGGTSSHPGTTSGTGTGSTWPGGHPGGPGPVHPGTWGHPGGPRGFLLHGRPFDLRKYHFTNPIWNWLRRNPYHGYFPGTPQLGFPYNQGSYPFMSHPFPCNRFPFSMMPQCRRFRRPFNWNRRPGFPGGHPGWPPGHGFPGGHPGMPGPHPGPGH